MHSNVFVSIIIDENLEIENLLNNNSCIVYLSIQA